MSSKAMPVWPAEIVTKEQVKHAVGELTHLRGWLKDYDRSVKVGAITSSPKPSLSPEAKLLAGEDLKKVTVKQLDALISGLETRLRSSLETHISLPDLPAAEIRSDLVNWFRNNISPKILLSFSADSSLSGGMVVRTRNHIYNFSLRRQLWEQRHLMPEILRRA